MQEQQQPTEDTQLTGQVNDEQIQAWKKQFPKGIYGIISEPFIAYFKNPELAHMNYATTKLTPEAPLDYHKLVLQATQIGGSVDEILNDTDRYIGAMQTLKEKLEGTKARLVNY